MNAPDLMRKEYTGTTRLAGPLLFVDNAADLPYGAVVDIHGSGKRIRRGQVIEVSEEAAVIHHADLPRENRRWRFRLYRLSPNYQLTVALEAADDVEVRLFEFDAADFD